MKTQLSTTKILRKLSLFAAGFLLGGFFFWLILPSNAAQQQEAAPCTATANKIKDQAEAHNFYYKFMTAYPTFNQKGGVIPKSLLCALYTSMTDPNDTKVYYYFARNNENENCLLFFGDPAYHAISGSSYKTVAAFCPPSCNLALTEYLR